MGRSQSPISIPGWSQCLLNLATSSSASLRPMRILRQQCKLQFAYSVAGYPMWLRSSSSISAASMPSPPMTTPSSSFLFAPLLIQSSY